MGSQYAIVRCHASQIAGVVPALARVLRGRVAERIVVVEHRQPTQAVLRRGDIHGLTTFMGLRHNEEMV